MYEYVGGTRSSTKEIFSCFVAKRNHIDFQLVKFRETAKMAKFRHYPIFVLQIRNFVFRHFHRFAKYEILRKKKYLGNSKRTGLNSKTIRLSGCGSGRYGTDPDSVR